MNSRKFDVCNIDVHRASYVKHLRNKKHVENMKQNGLIIPEWFFQEPIENKINKINNPKSIKQLARVNIRLDDRQLKKVLAKKMINPFYFTDRNLRVGFKIDLYSHHIDHANSKLTITPNYPEFGIEVRYINKINEELSVIYARLINQYIFEHQSVFSATFDKQDEDNQVINETDFFINIKINHKLTQTDINNIDVKSPLEHQIKQQEMKDSGWRCDKINSMTIYFYKTGEMNASNYVKIPLRTNAILIIEKNDEYCFIWSIIASFHPCNINHPNRVSNRKIFLMN